MPNLIDDYRARLKVNKHAVDDALEDQADVLERIGREVTRHAGALALAEDRLKTTEATLTLEFKRDDDKLTVPELAAKVRTASRRREDWAEVQRCVALHSDWQKLYRAWEERSYSLKGLASLHASGYFTASSHTMPRSSRPDDGARDTLRRSSRERAESRALQSVEDAGAEPARIARRSLV
ncbi:hypothetical protein D3C87_973730 [compost metagenome]